MEEIDFKSTSLMEMKSIIVGFTDTCRDLATYVDSGRKRDLYEFDRQFAIMEAEVSRFKHKIKEEKRKINNK